MVLTVASGIEKDPSSLIVDPGPENPAIPRPRNEQSFVSPGKTIGMITNLFPIVKPWGNRIVV